MRKFTFGLAAAALAVALLGTSSSAEAAFMLQVGGGPVVTDNAAGDLAPQEGAILSLYTDSTWLVTATGKSDPLLSAPYPHMDLNVSATSHKAGVIEIQLTDTDFTYDGLFNFWSNIGGTIAMAPVGASLEYSAYYSATNEAFAKDVQLFSCTITQGGAFTCPNLSSISFTNENTFSVTQYVKITHTGNQVTSFDAEFQVPEPTMLALFGLGLIGAARLRRRA